MVASPSDVSAERQLIRDVIYEWNSIHSEDRGVVLQPVGWDTHASPSTGDRPQAIINKQVLAGCDLLIAAFWTRLGSPTGTSQSGTVEEINEHISAGKPAMIYFSQVPVRMDSVENEQYTALLEFRGDMSSRGIYDTYETLEEFRQKLFRQLSQTIIRQFKNSGDNTTKILDTVPLRPTAPAISPEAKELLVEASQDKHGLILTIQTFSGISVRTNEHEFVADRSPREAARWQGAIRELISVGAIEPQGTKREIYRVTHQGYEIAERFKTTDWR